MTAPTPPPATEMPPAHAKLVELLKQFAEKTAQQNEEGIAALRPMLHNEYWNLCLETMEQLVSEPPFPQNLTFDRRQLIQLNFGMTGMNIFDWEEEAVKRVIAEPKTSGRYRIQLVYLALNAVFRDFLNYDLKLNYKSQKSRIQRQMEMAVQYVGDMRERARKLSKQFLSPADSTELLILCEQYDERLRPVLEMEQKIKEKGISKKEDITRFAQLKEEMSGLAASRSQMLDKCVSGGAEIQQVIGSVQKGYVKILELYKEDRQLEKKMRESNKQVTRLDVIASLKDELKTLKMFMNMCAQMCRLVPMSLLVAPAEIATPLRVEMAMDQILDFDPDIFNNRQVKREGLPALLIVPGIGNGMYDWSKNRMVIPAQSAKSLVENVASAMVMYRMDIDQQFCDRKLINSYRNEIKRNKEIRSIRKLRDTLREDYVVWVTKEAEGYTIMEKEVRDWFELNIGPKKLNVIIPRRLRGLTLKEVNDEIGKLGAGAGTLEQTYDLGVLYALKEDFENAVTCFDRVISIDPHFMNAYYSGGICYRRLKDKRGNQYLTEFAKRAPQSWWSKKAQEQVSKGS